MTRRERVRETLRHRRPDVCPWDVRFTVPAARKLAEHYGREDFRGEIGCHVELIGHAAPESWTEISPGYWRDEFGVVWNRTVDRDIGNPAPGNPKPEARSPIQVRSPRQQMSAVSFVVRVSIGFRVSGFGFRRGDFGFSLFERAWTLRGMEALLVDMVEDPAFVHDVPGDVPLENLLALIEVSPRGSARGELRSQHDPPRSDS